jgi:hypothetical protein
VALHHFRDVLQLLNDVLVHGAALQVDAYVGAGRIAETLGVDVEATAGDDVSVNEVLDALVDGSA